MQPQMPPIDSPDKLFHDGNPLTGEKGTIVTATFLNNNQGAVRDVQSELIAVLTAAGYAPDKDTVGQLLASLKSLFLIRKTPFSDIAADGPTAVSAALKNLGLGDGTALPFGVPIPWPVSTPPDGWITMSGQAITAAQYPKLYALYGASLPDLRGEFIRGWDNARGVDSGRTLLSAQAASRLHEYLGNNTTNSGVGYTTVDNSDGNEWDSGWAVARNSSQTTNSSGCNLSKVRPRNIAFNYIVRGI